MLLSINILIMHLIVFEFNPNNIIILVWKFKGIEISASLDFSVVPPIPDFLC